MKNSSIQITSVTLVGADAVPSQRLLKIALSNGETVSVAGCYGGYEQYGTFREHYATTQPVAQRYTKWLNGGSQPRPLAKYVTIEQTHPELTAD